MAKKNFKQGIDGLLQGSMPEKERAEKKNKAPDSKSIKATYYLDPNLLKQIKAIAFYDRRPIGHVVNEALRRYAAEYEELELAVKLFK